MGKEFYIADTHFGHANVLKYDRRPFATIDESDEVIIANWNRVVSDEDTVWILGDLSWYNTSTTKDILRRLHGNKKLITGNHDGRMLKDPSIRSFFEEITPYKEARTKDGNMLVLSHYPIPFFNGHFRNGIHLYGHVHNSKEWDLAKRFAREIIGEGAPCRMYNVGCMIDYMGYTPRTLEEILEANSCVDC